MKSGFRIVGVVSFFCQVAVSSLSDSFKLSQSSVSSLALWRLGVKTEMLQIPLSSPSRLDGWKKSRSCQRLWRLVPEFQLVLYKQHIKYCLLCCSFSVLIYFLFLLTFGEDYSAIRDLQTQA